MGKPPEGGDLLLACLLIFIGVTGAHDDYGCPSQEKIAPCRCSTRDMEYQIWCSHSELPKVLEGLSAVSRYITHPIDELILENNNLPSLPGKVFTSLRVLRLMLRHNRLERVSSGWLEGLHDSLLELFLVEPDLRSLPIDSLDNLQGLEAITLQSSSMKRLPRFSGLSKLRYLQINSFALTELTPSSFRDLPKLEQLHVFGSPQLIRLEAGLFRSLPKLSLINITACAITWIHPRAFVDLPDLNELSLTSNKIPDALVVGRAIVDLPRLSTVRLDSNRITRLHPESFTGIISLSRLTLSNNFITEISAGAFQNLPDLRVLDLNKNLISRVHPEFFIARLSSLEELWITNNHLSHVDDLRSILGALPRLKLLDASYNHLAEIPFGALGGHPTLERLHLDHNRLAFLQRETFSAMPALRELRLKNNSLTNLLEPPFWNLPGLKGLDLSENYFRTVERRLLGNLPNLRRLDLSGNGVGVIDADAFVETPALEFLNLSRNAIAEVHPMTLRHLGSLYEVDASWNRILEVIPGLPKGLEHLHLAMNRIVMLPVVESGDLALPKLRTLDLSANGIERIPPGILRGLLALKKLDLGYNSLRMVEDGSFEGLGRLEQLDLRYNRIVAVHGGSLRDLRSLMDLSLRGNRLEVIRSDVFAENVMLQRLDLGKNHLAQIPHAAFDNTRDLKELYASYNTLTELPGSLHGLAALEVLDLSFNKLNILSPETLSSLNSLLELRLVRNKIKELREGAFNRLPRLTFIDLESNDLRIIERNAVKNLPELQAIRLAKNRIQMIPSGAFTDLPALQTAELQENRIEEIASNAFINVPHILFLNLSNNQLPSLEHAGLFSLRSLEVLDVSNNRLTRVSTESLAAMEWLVELKLDQNRICGIQGVPFDNMSRLRVLSMRRNRMTSIPENAFKRLRSNIAVLDVDENPLSCSCGMIWLRGWLQQGSTEGPRCADGTLFREMRLTRLECQQKRLLEPVLPGCETEVFDQADGSYYGEGNAPAPWMNLKSPSKIAHQDYSMYDDYSEHQFENISDQSASEDIKKPSTYSPISPTPPPSHTPSETIPSSTPRVPSNTLPQKKKHPPIPPSPSSSGFTFFGVPLPNFGFNLWGKNGKKANRRDDGRPYRGRYRTFPPSEPEIQKGGFRPLPQPTGGFRPIPDPRLTFPKRGKNEGVKGPERNKTATVTRVQSERKRPSSTSTSSSPSSTSSSTPKTTRNHQETTPGTEVIKISPSNHLMNLTIPVTLSSNVSNKSVSISTEVYNAENLDVDSEESVMLVGKVASKVFWTTPGSIASDVLKTSAPGTYQSRGKNGLLESEDHTSLVKPESTSPMSSVDLNLVTTEDSRDEGISTMKEETIATTQVRGMEASALSAFLVPGGQIGSQVHQRFTGRPIIEKVAAPHLGNQSLLAAKGNESLIEIETGGDVEAGGDGGSTDGVNDNEDPFNWYFQNYNESSLEPFIGVVYSGSERIECQWILGVLTVIVRVDWWI